MTEIVRSRTVSFFTQFAEGAKSDPERTVASCFRKDVSHLLCISVELSASIGVQTAVGQTDALAAATKARTALTEIFSLLVGATSATSAE